MLNGTRYLYVCLVEPAPPSLRSRTVLSSSRLSSSVAQSRGSSSSKQTQIDSRLRSSPVPSQPLVSASRTSMEGSSLPREEGSAVMRSPGRRKLDTKPQKLAGEKILSACDHKREHNSPGGPRTPNSRLRKRRKAAPKRRAGDVPGMKLI